MQYSEVQIRVVQRSVVKCNGALSSAVLWVYFSAVHCGVAQCSVAQCDAVQWSAV